MSSKIDQRIVEMSFENHKFEEGIKRSKNSLKEFSNALEGMGTGKDFKGLEQSIQSTSSSFSLLEQVGIGALRRIGEAALNAGTQLMKSLTIDPLTTGWTKYEQKTASVQTIMNATGKSIDEVNGYLNKLMWFSDETSYGFTDMTAALAQMTSSGGDIDKLIPLITGVANATAYAGKGAGEFSRAMYNLNQSYGMGNLQFMDWRSLELAGVAGKDLKQIFIDTGIALGKLDKSGRTAKGTLVDIGTFGSTLQEKWADTKVMEAAFGKFSELSEAAYELVNNGTYDTAAEAMQALSGQYSEIAEKGFKSAQQAKSFSEAINATLDAVSSGWMRTYEIIFGYLPEATKNFTALAEVLWTVFAAGAEGRNDMLQMIKDAGGIKTLFKGIKNIAVALLKPLKAVSQAFDQFFPSKTKDQWMGIINTIEAVTSKFIMTDEVADKVRRTFAGFFAVIDTGWTGVKFLGSALFEVVRTILPFGDSFLDITATFGDFLVKLNRVIKQSGVFKYALLGVKVAALVIKNTIGSLAGKVGDFVHTLLTTEKPLEVLAKTVKNIFSGFIDSLKTGVKWISTKFMKAITSVQKFFDSKFDIEKEGAIGKVLEILKEFLNFLTGGATETISSFGDALKNLDFRKITTFVTGGILLLFINQLSNLTKVTADLVSSTNGFVSKLTKKMFGTQTKIKDFAISISILTGSLVVLSNIPWDKLKTGLTGLAGSMLIFVGAYAAIQAITVIASKQIGSAKVMKAAFDLTALAGGLIIMASAIKVISTIDETKVWRSVGVVAAMMGLLSAYQALSVLISIIPGARSSNAKITGMAIGLLGIIGIVVLLNYISSENLRQGLLKLAQVMIIIVTMQSLFALASRLSGGNKVSIKLVAVSLGILSLLGVLNLLTYVTPRDITAGVKNLILLGGVLAGIQLMFNIASRIGGGIKVRTNIFSMQIGIVSMIILTGVLGKMDQKDLQNGIKNLAKMAGIVGALEVLTGLAARIGGGIKLQKILGSVTLTLISFTVLIGVLNMYKQETIDRGILNIIKMSGIIVALQTLTGLIGMIKGSARSTGAIFGIVTLLLTITASLALLSMIEVEPLKKAAEALSMAVLAIGAMAIGISIIMKLLDVMSINLSPLRVLVKNLIPSFLIIGMLIAGVLGLLAVIKASSSMLEGISAANIGKFAVALALIGGLIVGFTLLAKLPGLSGAAALSGLVTGFAGAGAAIIATRLLFLAINSVLPIIKSISLTDIGKFTAGLAMVGIMILGLTLLGPSLAILGGVGGYAFGGVLTAILSIATVVGAVVILASIMEGLFGSSGDFLLAGIDKLVEVGRGIGRFIGAIAGGFSSELLIGYGEGIAGFADQIKDIDGSAFSGVESLAKAFLILTGTTFLDGLNRLLGFKGDPGTLFGKQLKGLVTALEEISVDKAKNASAVIAALAPMVDNLKALANAAQSIPNSGGFLGKFMGENDINTFGNDLKLFIWQMSAMTVAQVNTAGEVLAALALMAENLKILARAADSIPNSGGFIGDFLGNNDVGDFGSELKWFVYNLSEVGVADAVNATNVLGALAPMAVNLKTFAEAAEKIPETGGVAGFFAGNNEVDVFASKIKGTVQAFASIDQMTLGTANANVNSMSRLLLPGLERFIALINNISATPTATIQPTFSSLTTLAKEIKTLVNTLKGVDVSIIGPAFASLDTINTAFRIVGKDVVDSAVKSIQNNTPLFQTQITKLLDSTTRMVQLKRPDITNSFRGLLDPALDILRSYIDDFEVVGGQLVKGLQNGINSNAHRVVTASKSMSNLAIRTTKNTMEVKSPSKVFEGIGKWLPAGLAVGIERNSKVAILASTNMASGVENAVRDGLDIHSIGSLFPGIGSWIPPGISAGITDAKNGLLKIAGDLGIDTSNMSIQGITSGLSSGEGAITKGINALLDLLTGETSLSDIMNTSKDLGTSAGSGFSNNYANEVAKGGKGVSKAYNDVATDAFQAFKENIDKRRDYNLITTWQEIQAWEEFAKQYKKGTEMRMKIDKELGRLKFEYAKTWIDEEKYYKRLSLDEELAAWEKVQSQYAAGHEYRMQAEREIFRLKEEIWQAEYDHALDYIDDEKYYGRMDLSEELAAWKQLFNFTEKGSEERKKVDREIFRLENEIRDKNLEYENKVKEIEKNRQDERLKLEEEYYDKTKEVNDKLSQDIKSLNDEYENAFKSRADSLYSTYGLFDKPEKPEYVSGFQLVNNLEEQNAAFDKWQSSIGTLAAKGIDDGLIKELRDMGPKSLAQINALNRLSDTELTRYVDLWQKKSQEAKDQSTSELQGLKDENTLKIIEMTNAANFELAKYNTIWQTSLAELNSNTQVQLDQLKTEWTTSVGSMTDDSMLTLRTFGTDWFTELGKTIAATKTQMAELKSLTTNIAPAATAVADVVKKAVSTSSNNNNNTKTQSIGKNIVAGIAQGIQSGVPAAVQAQRRMNQRLEDDTKKFWQIKSPSKKALDIAKYIVMGLANGFTQFTGMATDASNNLGESALNALSIPMSGIPDLLSGNVGEFAVTPVLDLANVNNGINGAVSATPGLDLTSTMNLLPDSSQTNQNGIIAAIRDGLLAMSKPEVDLSGNLTVEVVNDKGEIVGIAETAIKDLLRRESR